MTGPYPQDVQRLVDAGDWRAAATLAERSGHFDAARQLYEELLDHASAGRVAAIAGDEVAALESFLRGGHGEAAEQLRVRMVASLSEHLPAAVDVLVRYRRHHAAAELASAIGRLEDAAHLFAEGHAHLDAASHFERIGRFREAGRHYEGHLADVPDSLEARLGLGRVLQRFERPRASCEAFLAAWAVGRDDAEFGDEIRERLAYDMVQLRMRDVAALALGSEGYRTLLDTNAFAARFRETWGAGATGFTQRYRIQGEVAGPFVEAYAAHDTMTGSDVLIQPLHGPRNARERYVAVQRQLATSRVPGTLRFVDALGEPVRFAVFAAPPGPTLAQVLDAPERHGFPDGLSFNQALGIVRQVVTTLTLCHRSGVVHGSVGPWSVFVGAGLSVALGGFAVASLGSRAETATAGGLDNPLSYLAPEAAFGGEPDYRTDFYGVGALLWRVLTGRPPLGRRPGDAGPGDALPAAWVAWFDRMLDPDPDRRPERHDELDAVARLPTPGVLGGVLGGLLGGPSHARVRAASGGGLAGRFSVVEDRGATQRLRDEWLEREVIRVVLPLEAGTADRIRALASVEAGGLQPILASTSSSDEVTVDLAARSAALRPLDEWRDLAAVEILARERALRAVQLAAARVAALHRAGEALGLPAGATLLVDVRDGAAWVEIASLLAPHHLGAAAFQRDLAGLRRWLVSLGIGTQGAESASTLAALARAAADALERGEEAACARAAQWLAAGVEMERPGSGHGERSARASAALRALRSVRGA